jgi:hypothetical protein
MGSMLPYIAAPWIRHGIQISTRNDPVGHCKGQGSLEAARAQNLTMASGFKGFTRCVVGITQSPTRLRV